MDRKRWLPAWTYRILYAYLELYETRFETLVATLEIGLIAYGIVAALRELRPRGEGSLATFKVAFESAEFVIFLLLLGIALSRLLVSIRRSKLGYVYPPIGSSDDPNVIQGFQQRIESTPLGYAPGLLSNWYLQAQVVADTIAVQTASLLSMRSWFFIDRRWQSRERDSLAEWFKEFPAALWVIPETSAAESESIDKPFVQHALSQGGYVSVIVPMTRHSGRSIRNGQRATDLAELDLALLEFFDESGAHTASADLLAYLHIHVPGPGGSRERDETKLLAASIQHLAFLLHGLYGADQDTMDRWNFSVLCESSNRSMNAVLERLGFARLIREPDGSETQRREARSYAGFTLFELKVSQGNCAIADGRLFLVMLRKMVDTIATQSKATAA